MKGRHGKRLKHLLDDFKEERRCCKLKEDALHGIMGNWDWKKLWTCPKTDYRMNEYTVRSHICDVE